MEHLELIFGDYEEVEDVQVNDYLWFERKYIYESLGLNEYGEIIDEDEEE